MIDIVKEKLEITCSRNDVIASKLGVNTNRQLLTYTSLTKQVIGAAPKPIKRDESPVQVSLDVDPIGSNAFTNAANPAYPAVESRRLTQRTGKETDTEIEPTVDDPARDSCSASIVEAKNCQQAFAPTGFLLEKSSSSLKITDFESTKPNESDSTAGTDNARSSSPDISSSESKKRKEVVSKAADNLISHSRGTSCSELSQLEPSHEAIRSIAIDLINSFSASSQPQHFLDEAIRAVGIDLPTRKHTEGNVATSGSQKSQDVSKSSSSGSNSRSNSRSVSVSTRSDAISSR